MTKEKNIMALRIAIVMSVFIGCQKEDPIPTTPDLGIDAVTECEPGERRCVDNLHQWCKDGVFVDIEECVSPQICSTTLGRCAECEPGQNICDKDKVYECTNEGIVGEVVETCAYGQCINGNCGGNPCEVADELRSYLGCDYWPTVTANVVSKMFAFAVVVANPQEKAVDVVISTKTNQYVAMFSVPSHDSVVAELPWVDLLKGATNSKSLIVEAGAYHLKSSLPVTVYQFNPLHYVVDGGCSSADGKCYSYTNDASLLLPQGALTQKYMVVTRPTIGTSSGSFTVVATKPGITDVKVTFSADSDVGDLGAFKKGDVANFSLSQWDVLQVFSGYPTELKDMDNCYPIGLYDFTGTLIEANQEIAAFAGHVCTFAPCDKGTCDHLEEQLFPIETLGKHYVGTNTLSAGDDPSLYRFVSAEDENILTFDPPISEPVKLQAGEFVEIPTTTDFEVKGTGRFALAQFMVGQNYSDTGTEFGDPSMALSVPVEQFRKDYYFLAPHSYTQNYVNIVIPKGTSVDLDGSSVTDFSNIDSFGEYQVAKLRINSGAHSINASNRVGIMVYGVGKYTSYMYPGGLDLRILIE